MSWVKCPVCGRDRKVEAVYTPDGWPNTECWNCGDPGWTNPQDAEDPFEGRTPEGQAAWIRMQEHLEESRRPAE